MATALDGELAATVHAWMEDDPDAADRAELQALIDRAGAGDEAAAADLTRRFAGRLAFGTAGLRAELGAGPMRMNRLVVRRAAAGLMRFLDPGATVVIGFDARHRSDEFARDTAGVVAAAGGRALLLPVVVPTPVLAFAIRHLGADAGVMCTASHNPPSDNGYKVYLGDGAQIIPPVDAAIAAHIDEAAVEAEPPPLAAAADPGIEHLTGEVIDAYLRHAVATGRPGPRRLRIAYTPLHGVGRDVAVDVLRRAGFTDIHEVTEQAEPDPDFPTVAFPNPEEPGALDHAIALARRVDADVILANDPDADRLGVAVPAAPWMTPTEVRDDPGERPWVALTGNEIGALLADHVLRHGTGGERLVVTTFVSSSLLHRLAADHGVHAAEVPTGFKWVVRPGLEDPSLRFVFGFEEALGFSVDEYVRDKDGITAALAFAELAAACAAEQRSVWDALERLARRHGHHATRTWSVRFPGPDAHAEMRAVMDRLRAEPPAVVGPHPVTEVRDMLHTPRPPAGVTAGADRPPADAVVVHLGPAGRIIVRPSGTEPKIKVYLEVVVDVAAGVHGYPQARRDGDSRLEALRLAFAAHAGLPG